MPARHNPKYWGVWVFCGLLFLSAGWWIFFRRTPVVEAPVLTASPLRTERQATVARLLPLVSNVKQLSSTTGSERSLWESWMEPVQPMLMQHGAVLAQAQAQLLNPERAHEEAVADSLSPTQWGDWVILHRFLVLDGVRLLQANDLEGLKRLRAARRLNRDFLLLGEWGTLQAAASMAGEWSLAMFALLPRESYQVLAGMPGLDGIHWRAALRNVLQRDLATHYLQMQAWQTGETNAESTERWHWYQRVTFDMGSWLLLERSQRQTWVDQLWEPLGEAGQGLASAWWHWFDHAGSRHAAHQNASIWQARLRGLRQKLAVFKITDDMVRLRMALFADDQAWTSAALAQVITVQDLRNPLNGEPYGVAPTACVHVDLADGALPTVLWDVLPLCGPTAATSANTDATAL